MNRLEPAFLEVAEAETARIGQWFYPTPLIISPARYEELRTLQHVLYTAITFFVAHYADYESLLPLSPRARHILDLAGQRPYRVGTYRPDYVIALDNTIHVSEIGARFPLDGYFNGAVAEYIAAQLLAGQGIDHATNRYRRLLDHLFEYYGEFDRVCAIKSPGDRPMDLRLYTQIFDKAGIPCTVLTPAQLADQLELLSHAAVIDETNQMDLEALDEAVLEQLAAANSLNDLRTKFLIHDKRFLSVLSNSAFLADCLNEHDAAFLAQHIIPTYTRAQRPDLWAQASGDKDRWLIKPYLLGKSEGLLAGCVTDEERWQAAFAPANLERLVLQPFIRQKQFVGSLGGRWYQDHVVGACLCFDDEFLGPGRFRTSSFPVTNQGDDRKAAPVLAVQDLPLKSPFRL